HTEGSICLYLPEEKKLIAGDTLFAGSIGRTDLPGGNFDKIIRSLHTRLLALPDETQVVPGHGSETTIGEEPETNPFLQRQGESLLRQGPPSTPRRLHRQVPRSGLYPPPNMWHLGHPRSRGEFA